MCIIRRCDGQVKIRGCRIDVGDIEACISGHGMQDIALLSRRTMASPGAEPLVSDLARLSISAIVIAGDVGDAACVEKTLALFKEVRPLRGPIKTADLLDDGLLSTLTHSHHYDMIPSLAQR
ncbi:Beta-ketoacyl synthase domain-containing protein [Trichoderma simmonsii]|uniref:Beta-ketoacyl synthase domain-containing protein n=1 Tax=Trichoderma simmonsii TaxID=1491479 RepID=A0A8G0LKH2_9HYPO|nr:Beta-ketoacyl synthase domain-containing protein [Trichoderma simmonsii]